METERYETVVIGGGQAGLAVGYHLARRGLPFTILDAHARVGDSWRQRWDSLRLFSPARFDALDGLPFPAGRHSFPTKDEMGDYLEAYARHFDLPVQNGVRVDGLSREGDTFLIQAGDRRIHAGHVVVAMANYQQPKVPAFAADLAPSIRQIHSSEYRNPGQLREGGVLIVGAGNSGAEIAKEVAGGHQTWISGRRTGEIPFDTSGFLGRHALIRPVFRLLFHRILTVDTLPGRKARPAFLTRGGPLIRVKARHLRAAGVEWLPRTARLRDGLPVTEDGRVLDVANVIWCTGYDPGFSWIDLPVLGEHEPRHRRGVVPDEPGLYFVGLHYLYGASSSMVHGVGRDAEHVVKAIAARVAERQASLRSAPTHSRPADIATG